MHQLVCPHCSQSVSVDEASNSPEGMKPMVCDSCFEAFTPAPGFGQVHTTELPKFLEETIEAVIPRQQEAAPTGDKAPHLPKDRRFTLEILNGDDVGRVHVVDKASMVLGRHIDADIVFGDRGMSRQHARLDVEGKNLYLTDLDTPNGTYVDGERIRRAELTPGGVFTLGVTRIQLHQECFF